MKSNVALVALALSLASICWGQNEENKNAPPECTNIKRVHGSVPMGPFKTLPGESYKQSPIIKFEVQEGGTVSKAIIERSSGVADIDKKILSAVTRWKFKPRPAGCGVIESEMSVDIDFH